MDIDGIRAIVKENYLEIASKLAEMLESEDIPLISDGAIRKPPDIPLAAMKKLWADNPELIITLAALREFMTRKSWNVVQWKADHVLKRKSKRIRTSENMLVLLYHILEKGKNHLMDIMIKQMIHRKSFKLFNISGGKRSRPRFDIVSLTEDKVTKMLRKIDRKIADGLKSHCWHIIRDDMLVEIYYRRGHSEFLELPEKNVAEIIGKSTIIRLSSRGKQSELWAEQIGLAKKMLNLFAEQLFGGDAKYIQQIGYNESQEVAQFLDSIGSGTNPDFTLVALERLNSPFENAPSVRIETKKVDLKDTLSQLKNIGFDLLEDAVNNILEIAFIFKREKFAISIERRAKGLVLRFKGHRGSNKSLDSVIEYMRDEYGLDLTVGGK